MQSILRTALMFSVCATICALGSGCLGPKVLSENVVHVPALDPKVELLLKTDAPADVLVIYDDLDSKTQKVERRAFYLFANEERILNGHRPHYVKLSEGRDLSAVPLFQFPPQDTDSATNELYGFELSSHNYRLESHGKLLAEFELPQYERWFTAKKLFLFPAAVGADAVGAGAVIGTAAVIANPVGAANTVATAVQKH